MRTQREAREIDARWEQEMTAVVAQLEIAQTQLKQLMTPGAATEAEVARLQQQLTDEQEDIEELSSQLVTLDKDHQKLTEQHSVLTEENRVFRQENERLLKENAALRGRAGLGESGHAAARQDVEGLTLQLQEAADRLEVLMEEKEDLEIKSKELEIQVCRLEEALANNGQLVVEEGKSMVGGEEVMRTDISKLKRENERLTDELEAKEIRNTELLIEIETLEEEILGLVDQQGGTLPR